MWPFCKPHTSCTKKHVIIFLAGASAFHTFSHILIAFTGTLPIRVFGMEWGQKYNLAAIAINAAITAGLLYWAAKSHRNK